MIDTALVPDHQPRLNLLVAYPYMKSQLLNVLDGARDDIRLVVDSGAFTAWKAGKPIALDDYCKFLEELPVKPWRYFTLDVIGDPHGTMQNYETMLARGFTPVPIFTRGEDPSVLDDLYKTSDLVGVGGLVGTRGNHGFVNGIMERAAGRKVHWLGFTNTSFLKVWRPYMADSSTWSIGQRRRFIPVYAGGGRVFQFRRHDFTNGLPWEAAAALRRYGIDLLSCRADSAWLPTSRLVTDVGMLSYVDFSLDAQAQIGTLIFIAVSDFRAAELAITCYRQLHTRKRK
jgi:hypothetical protein